MNTKVKELKNIISAINGKKPEEIKITTVVEGLEELKPLVETLDINVTINIKMEHLANKAHWYHDVGDVTEGNKIFNSVTTRGLPAKAIIHIKLQMEGVDYGSYFIEGSRYKDNIACGYTLNGGGFTSGTNYLFMQGVIYINNENDTIDAHLLFNTNAA